MALVLSNRVQETCTSPGTGAVTLLGAVTGYQTFLSGVGNANTCYYCIADQGGSRWEVGLGTYSSSGNTLARTTPYAGSSATPVNFSSGTQNVFVTYPASKSVNLDAANDVTLPGNLVVPTQASLQATTLTRASIRPSLLLDFANTKKLDPRVTFSRASTATYYDVNGIIQTAAANVARFDHDSVTGESKGLLIEEQRTNLATYSDQFDNVVWNKVRSTVTANAIVAPDGTLSGDSLYEDSTAAATHVVRTGSGISITTGTAYTFSCYAKAGGRTQFGLLFDTTNSVWAANSYAVFDLSIGSVVSNPLNLSTSIVSVGNGWYRCSVTATSAATALGVIAIHTAANASISVNGDITKNIYIWGAQLEAGSFPTSYIPTVASQVTRSADSASMTGSNFSSWYRADEGSFAAFFALANNTAAKMLFRVGDSTNQTGSVGQYVFQNIVILDKNGTGTLVNNYSVPVSGAVAVFAYSGTAFASCATGTSVGTSTSSFSPVVNAMSIGGELVATNNKLNGTIKRIAFYPKRLSNAELQGLTS